MKIALTVNGRPVAGEVAPRTHLADFLREQLLLTGTHLGCEHGICGACTVEIDGEIARSCITWAVACDGAQVRTIEGFDDDPLMTRLRAAFTEAHALQCGYCTPGMLIAARDLVRRKRSLSRPQIRAEMSGNLCRCTGYQGIIDAIESVMAATPSPRMPSDHPQRRAAPSEPEGLRGEGRGEGQPHIPSSLAAAPRHARHWLGPAPGPVASPAAPPTGMPPASEPQRAARGSAAPRARRASRPPIAVEVGAMEQVEGATRLTQSFTLPHPREAVWALMSDVAAVARCMPGLALDSPPDGDKVSGRMEVKIGPIAARFAGRGTIEQFPADYRQVISGSGGDRASGSRASGSVDYRLYALEGDATRVEVAISYALTGPLAQVGRSGIVRDLVRRIGEAFAQNLDAELAEPGGGRAAATQLGGITLFFQLLADRLRALLARLFSRRT
jgi:carbon-monoxide dehydrogenase small subunit